VLNDVQLQTALYDYQYATQPDSAAQSTHANLLDVISIVQNDEALNFAAGGAGAPGHRGGFAELPGAEPGLVPPAVTEALKNDTGTLSNDHVTNDPTLTGSGDANAVVSLTIDGKSSATTVAADGNGSWAFTPTGLADGRHTVIASETDAAGNTGTATLTFTLDTVAPVSPSLALHTDSGSSGTDKITNSAVVDVSGLESGGSWQYSIDNAAHWINSSGTNLTLAGDGAKSVIVHQGDLAGNISGDSAAFTFTLDTTPPMDQITSDTLNKNNSFTIAGTSQKGAAVKIFDGAVLLGSTVPDANGHWVFTTQSLSSSSVHTFTSTATDIAGNVGQSTGAAIFGTGSNDTLNSTSGNDILTGRSGADNFVFSNALFGKDTITDFAATGAGHDVLQFDHSIFATNAVALAHATQVGNNVVVAYDAADTVTLTGVNLHQLSANDFHII
jgi:hypothetical protein